MQSANLFTVAPTAALGQVQGAGQAAAGSVAGLFGPADGRGVEAGDASGFAEALMAALMAAQPQNPQLDMTPTPEGEPVETVAKSGAGGSASIGAAGLIATGGIEAPNVGAADVDAAAVAPLETETEPGRVDLALKPTAASQVDEPTPDALGRADGKSDKEGPAAAAALKDVVRAVGRDLPAAQTVQSSTQPVSPPPPAVSAAMQVALLEAGPAETPGPAEDLAPPPVAVQQAVASAEAQKSTVPARHDPSKATRDRGQPTVGPSVGQATVEKSLAEVATATTAASGEASVVEMFDSASGAPVEDAALLNQTAEPASHTASAVTIRTAEAAAAFAEGAKVNSQTVAHLSAQIAKAAENGRSTRFDLQLEPLGLGKVDVRVEINRAGDIVADLRFDNPVAAADLKSRSGELAAALENAGFDPAKTQLSFSSGGQQNFAGQFSQDLWSQQQGQDRQGLSGRSFNDLGELADNTAAPSAPSGRTGGVDVRI